MGSLLSLGLSLSSTSLSLLQGCQDCSFGNITRLLGCLWGIEAGRQCSVFRALVVQMASSLSNAKGPQL